MHDWKNVAQAIIQQLKPGTIIALSGPLGAGKTTLVQFLARELGAETNPRSPTFALIHTYHLKNKLSLKRLVHVDAYRIEKPEDILPLNLQEELSEPGTVLAIEWPENIQSWLKKINVPKIFIKIHSRHPEQMTTVEMTDSSTVDNIL